MKSNGKLLLISLNDSDENFLWCWGDPAAENYARAGECSAISLLPAEVSASPVVVLVSALHIVLRHVEYPGNPRSVSAKALAYQCEESLLEEVEDLHWVILRREGTCYLIAGYRHADMTRWQQRLPFAPRQIIAMLPDVAAFPWQGSPAAYRLRGERLFSCGPWFGYNLLSSWEMASGGDFSEPASMSDAQTLWQCAATPFSRSVTLLKGAFSPRPCWRSANFWQRWLPVAMLILTLCSVSLALFNQRLRLMQTGQETARIYTQLFPSGKVPAQPDKVIAEQIKNIKEQETQAQFFSYAEQLLAALPENNPHRFISLIFDRQQQSMKATVDSTSLNAGEHVNQAGNCVVIQKVTGNYSSRFTIEIKASS